jgi:hypothetical protein
MTTAVHHYEDKLLEFAYGELPASEADTVDAHVRGCARCAESLAQIRSVRQAMSTLPLEPAPAAGLESLLAYAEQQAARNAEAAAPTSFFARFFSPRRVTALGTMAALMVVGIVAWKAKDEADSPAMMALKATESKVERKQGPTPAPVAVAPPAPAEAPLVAAGEAAPTGAKEDRAGHAAPDPQLDQGYVRAKNEKLEKKKAEKAQKTTLEVDAPGADQEAEAQAQAVAVGDLKTPAAAPVNDYSNASLQGPRLQTRSPAPVMATAPKAEPKTSLALRERAEPSPKAALAKDKDNKPAVLGGYGLNGAADDLVEGKQPSTVRDELSRAQGAGGTAATGGVVGRAGGKADLKDASKEQAPAPVAAQVPAAPPSQAPAPSKKGSLGLSSSSTMQLEEAPADKHGTERADGTGTSVNDRRRSTLEAARDAFQRNDRQAEVRFSLDALSLGVTGSERLEALRRACDGFDALGEPDQAEPYCSALQREFPGSSAADTVSRRRLSVQKPNPAKASKRAADQSESEKKVAPASKQSAPSQAY